MPWLEDLKFPRGYQMGTHKTKYIVKKFGFDKIFNNCYFKDSYERGF